MSLKAIAASTLERLGRQHGTLAEQLEQTEQRSIPKHVVEHENWRNSANYKLCSIVPSLGRGTVEHGPDWRAMGADPDSPLFVLDDEEGWIGWSPRRLHAQLAWSEAGR
jgi:hypothetical protein